MKNGAIAARVGFHAGSQDFSQFLESFDEKKRLRPGRPGKPAEAILAMRRRK